MYNLALMYDEGDGVIEDNEEAIRLYGKAAKLGHDLSQNNLGVLYSAGDGVKKNFILAYMWYLVSADSENDLAKENQKDLRSSLSRKQRKEAEQMAEICIKSDYQDCNWTQ